MRRKLFSEMTVAEALEWIEKTREALIEKMKRERAYLDRRAARKIYNAIDESYEDDQWLEADLLTMLEEMEKDLRGA